MEPKGVNMEEVIASYYRAEPQSMQELKQEEEETPRQVVPKRSPTGSLVPNRLSVVIKNNKQQLKSPKKKWPRTQPYDINNPYHSSIVYVINE